MSRNQFGCLPTSKQRRTLLVHCQHVAGCREPRRQSTASLTPLRAACGIVPLQRPIHIGVFLHLVLSDYAHTCWCLPTPWASPLSARRSMSSMPRQLTFTRLPSPPHSPAARLTAVVPRPPALWGNMGVLRSASGAPRGSVLFPNVKEMALTVSPPNKLLAIMSHCPTT